MRTLTSEQLKALPINPSLIFDAEQKSDDWLYERLGKVTGTGFKNVIDKNGCTTHKSNRYLADLFTEMITGNSTSVPDTKHIERGNELEPIAREAYEIEYGVDLIEVGGVYKDLDKRVMVSPDGLIAYQRKGVEFKCPMIQTHIMYCLNDEVPSDYIAQVVGNMWVTGFEEWDFVSFCPEFAQQIMFVKTLKRTDPEIAKMLIHLDEQVPQFIKRLDGLLIEYKQFTNG